MARHFTISLARLLCCTLLLFTEALAAQQDFEANDAKIESAVLQLVSTIELPATASGPLRTVLVQQGSMVVADQLLATINDEAAKVRLQEALIELQIAKRELESDVDIQFALKSKQVALADYRRAQQSNLGYAGVVSDREMDRLKLLVEKSDAEVDKNRFEKSILAKQVELKQAAVDKMRIEVKRHEIRAPIAGQIVELKHQAGEWVAASDSVMKLVQLDRLKVEERLPVSVATTELVGAKATFVSSSGAQSIDGIVTFVNPVIDPLNARVNVRIEFENEGMKLRPGMKGTVNITRK